jgi:hypothetical protein
VEAVEPTKMLIIENKQFSFGRDVQGMDQVGQNIIKDHEGRDHLDEIVRNRVIQ